MARMLVIPAESHPTDHSFLEEVHARADDGVERIFLMRSREDSAVRDGHWHRARLRTFPLRSGVKPVAWLAVYCADLRYVTHLLRLARQQEPELVYVRDLTFPLFLAVSLRPLFGWRVIYQKSFPHERRWFDPDQVRRYRLPWLYRLARRIEIPILRWLTHRADAVLPISAAMGEELAASGSRLRGRLHPFGMGVCDEAHHAPPPAERRPGEALGLVYVGTLAPGRRLDTLLDALRIARDDHGSDARLTVLGGRSEEIDTLREQVTQRGLSDRVDVLGRIDRSEVYEVMARHHAGAIFIPRDPRFRVASTTKLLESLAVGLPCVCTDAVAMHAILLEQGEALVLTDDSAPGFAAGILELDQRWEELSHRARKRRNDVFLRFSYARARERMADLLESLIGPN